MARFLIVAAVAAVGGAASCGPVQDHGGERALVVADAYAPEPLSDEAAAVYLTVWNGTAVPDTLLGAASPIAAAAGLHREMAMGAMMHMEPAAPLVVPAGGGVRLEPEGTHLMLERLLRRPRAGDTIDVTLRLSRAGTIAVRVPVIPYTDVPERAAAARGREPAR